MYHVDEVEDDPLVLPVQTAGDRSVGEQRHQHPAHVHSQRLLYQNDEPEICIKTVLIIRWLPATGQQRHQRAACTVSGCSI